MVNQDEAAAPGGRTVQHLTVEQRAKLGKDARRLAAPPRRRVAVSLPAGLLPRWCAQLSCPGRPPPLMLADDLMARSIRAMPIM